MSSAFSSSSSARPTASCACIRPPCLSMMSQANASRCWPGSKAVMLPPVARVSGRHPGLGLTRRGIGGRSLALAGSGSSARRCAAGSCHARARAGAAASHQRVAAGEGQPGCAAAAGARPLHRRPFSRLLAPLATLCASQSSQTHPLVLSVLSLVDRPTCSSAGYTCPLSLLKFAPMELASALALHYALAFVMSPPLFSLSLSHSWVSHPSIPISAH